MKEAFWRARSQADRDAMQAAFAAAAAWQDEELLAQKAGAGDALKAAGMTVITAELEAWRAPVLAGVPAQVKSRWGAGNFDALRAL